MKKLLFLLFVSFSMTFSFSFAAKETVDIKEVKLRYCNSTGSVTKSLLFATKPSEEKKVCMEFTNEGSIGATIGVNFVDGTLTADGDQKKACLPEAEKVQFGQYVTGYESSLYIPPRGMVRTYAKIKFPAGYAGASYGCVTYFLPDAKKETIEQEGKMFEIFARVGSFVDVFVDGKITPSLITIPVQSDMYSDIGSNTNMMIYHDKSWKYYTKTIVFNTGNIAVSGDISLGWSTRGGLLQSHILLTGQTILPQQFQAIEQQLPRYVTRLVGGPTTVTLSVDYSPIYLGAFNTGKNDETYTLVDHNSHFFFPWILLVLVILIYLLSNKKKKRSLIKSPSFSQDNKNIQKRTIKASSSPKKVVLKKDKKVTNKIPTPKKPTLPNS